MTAGPSDAQAFAESVAGVATRAVPADAGWEPGGWAHPWPGLDEALTALDWGDLAADTSLTACAGLGAFELGRRAAPLNPVDSLLGGSPLWGDLVRCVLPDGMAVAVVDGAPFLRRVIDSERLPSADGLDVHRVTRLGPAVPADQDTWDTARRAWLAAGVGYLAGVGQAALDLTVDYVSERAAFGTTLAGLAPVQQLLAGAATAVRGVRLLASEEPSIEALAHAGPAVSSACAACQQVTGAIGFTLEYSLHRFTQRARAMTVWNDALIEIV